MGYKVKADPVFWDTLDAAGDDPDLLDELYDVCFALVQAGPALPFAEPARLPIGPVLVPGWTVDLLEGRAFMGYVAPETLGHDYILLCKLVIYDWPEV